MDEEIRDGLTEQVLLAGAEELHDENVPSSADGAVESHEEPAPPVDFGDVNELEEARAELDRLRQEQEAQKAQSERLVRILQESGYPGDVNGIADELEAQRRETSPEHIRKEREALEQAKQATRQAEQVRGEADRLLQQAIFASDLAEIQRIDPAVKSLDQLGAKFFQLRAAGFGNVEAFDLLQNVKTSPKAAPQAGKDHLVTTGGGVASAVLRDIPGGELELWQESFPGDTPAKLKERYNRAIKRQGGQ